MNKKTKLCFIIEHLNIGGAERHLSLAVRHLNKDLFDITLCCLRETGTLGEQLIQEGYSVFVFSKKRKLDLPFLIRLIKFLRKNKFDIIHTHLFTANLWGTIAGRVAGIKKIISHEHSLFVFNAKRTIWIKRLLTHFTTQTIVVSNDIQNRLFKILPRKLEKKVIKIHNGVPVFDKNKRSYSKNDFKISPNAFLIGMMSRLEIRKDFDTLLKSITLLREKYLIHLLIIGDGELKYPLKNKISEMNLNENITLLGNRSDIDQLLPLLDVFVLSSHTEGLPMCILEAMSHKIPVIATNVGGVKEVIDDNHNGLLVDHQNEIQLANTIEKLIKDRKASEIIAHNGYARVKSEFSVEKTTMALEAVYRNVLTAT